MDIFNPLLPERHGDGGSHSADIAKIKRRSVGRVALGDRSTASAHIVVDRGKSSRCATADFFFAGLTTFFI